MESYHGLILTPGDALILIEAARTGVIGMVSKRLTKRERVSCIKSGAIFIWEESLNDIQRWTDGKSWSSSSVVGKFLTYNELDPRKRVRLSKLGQHELLKQTFSAALTNGQTFHVVSYCLLDYFKIPGMTPEGATYLKRPTQDPLFRHLQLVDTLYHQIDLENIDYVAKFYKSDPASGRIQHKGSGSYRWDPVLHSDENSSLDNVETPKSSYRSDLTTTTTATTTTTTAKQDDLYSTNSFGNALNYSDFRQQQQQPYNSFQFQALEINLPNYVDGPYNQDPNNIQHLRQTSAPDLAFNHYATGMDHSNTFSGTMATHEMSKMFFRSPSFPESTQYLAGTVHQFNQINNSTIPRLGYDYTTIGDYMQTKQGIPISPPSPYESDHHK